LIDQRNLSLTLVLILLGTAWCRSETKSLQAYSEVVGGSSFIFVKPPSEAAGRRLTNRTGGWETEPTISPDGKVVAYALADGPNGKSEVWISHLDGTQAHRVSAPDEDALLPAFGPDSRLLLYVKSRFTGHYSPIARPRKHDFDIVKIVVDPDGPVAGAVPIELTQQHFFDMRSLSVSPDGQHFLLSTSGYPIGSLIEEFDLASPLEIKKIFQPHVPSEPGGGPSFGQAAYTPDGMSIIFTAATEGQGGMFDYNIYQMSDVTGAQLSQLTHHSGMIDTMTVGRDGTIFFSEGKMRYAFNPRARTVAPE
jgi:dipeptidyl aminopeptidase/acylaminoacyl peptidase